MGIAMTIMNPNEKKARQLKVRCVLWQEGHEAPISPETGRPIDLRKIFTPATDSGEVTPRKRRPP